MSRPRLLDKSMGVKHTLSKQNWTEEPLRQELAQEVGRSAQGRLSCSVHSAALGRLQPPSCAGISHSTIVQDYDTELVFHIITWEDHPGTK